MEQLDDLPLLHRLQREDVRVHLNEIPTDTEGPECFPSTAEFDRPAQHGRVESNFLPCRRL